jgi:hypothetical protein
MMRPGKFGAVMPVQSIVLFLLCAAGVLFFLLLIILPSQKLSAEYDQDILALRARIEEQKILLPVFKNLFEKSKAPAPAGLPSPAKQKLARTEVGNAPKIVRKVAESQGVAVKEISLDVNSVADASGRVVVNFSAFGQFMDFRRLLMELAALPYLESLDDIEVSAVEGGEEIAMKIFLARE